ncbi:hypothetical protein PSP6_290092 [Paraburkholderia tropica]|nr:hypothetical protein PSP6_290092 [Paraburkholderia tropica]
MTASAASPASASPFVPFPPLAQLAADLAAGRTTSRALAETALARIADPAGQGATVFTHVERTRARRRAVVRGQLHARGAGGGRRAHGGDERAEFPALLQARNRTHALEVPAARASGTDLGLARVDGFVARRHRQTLRLARRRNHGASLREAFCMHARRVPRARAGAREECRRMPSAGTKCELNPCAFPPFSMNGFIRHQCLFWQTVARIWCKVASV